jgi:hypothetical protein
VSNQRALERADQSLHRELYLQPFGCMLATRSPACKRRLYRAHMSRFRDIRRFVQRALSAPTIALITVASASIVAPMSVVTPYAGASTVPTCNVNDLQLEVDFDGPGNPSGAIVLEDLTQQTCEIFGQPHVEVFSSSHRELKLSESMFEFTPRLLPPAAPILISASHPWAVVEMRWCGFPVKYSRVIVRFPGWAHSVILKESTIEFEPPVCRHSGASQLAVDDVRRLSAEGIAGRQPRVSVSPSSNLRDGEKVRVTVSSFGLGAKFFVSECADATDVSPAGCGGQLALQNFGLTNMIGDGSYVVTVKNVAATGLSPNGPIHTCVNSCVLVATGGEGGASSYATLRFS